MVCGARSCTPLNVRSANGGARTLDLSEADLGHFDSLTTHSPECDRPLLADSPPTRPSAAPLPSPNRRAARGLRGVAHWRREAAALPSPSAFPPCRGNDRQSAPESSPSTGETDPNQTVVVGPIWAICARISMDRHGSWEIPPKPELGRHLRRPRLCTRRRHQALSDMEFLAHRATL